MIFPDNLTPAEARAVEAVMTHGDASKAARTLGVKETTVNTQIATARDKAGAGSTIRLVLAYLDARPHRWPR